MPGAVRSIRAVLSASVSGYVANMQTAAKATVTSMGTASAAVGKHDAALRVVESTSKRVAAAGGILVAVAVKSAATFEKQMSSVAAATQAPRRELQRMGSAALKAGASTAYSATEAAGAIEDLAKAGIKTRDILGGGLKGALNLAAAGQIEVGVAAEAAASAMTQFRLKGRDVPHIADLLAAAAGKAQGEVSDYTMALNQAGLVSSQVGLSIEETTGALAAFGSAGLLGSDAGTSLKTMLLNLVPQSAAAARKMDEIGFSAFDANGKFVGLSETAKRLRDSLKGMSDQQRQGTLKKIFGQDAIRAASILYREGGDGIEKWIGKVNDSGYAAKVAHTKMDNLIGDLKKFRGALNTGFIKSGSGAQQGIREILQDATDLVNKFNELPSSVQKGAVKAVAAAAVLGGGVWAASKVTGAVRNIGGGAGGIAAKAGVVPVFVTNPGFGGLGGDLPGGGGSRGGSPLKQGARTLAKRGLIVGGVVAAGALAHHAADSMDDADRFYEKGDKVVNTAARIKAALKGADIGKYSKDLGIDLDRLATDMARYGDDGEYVRKVQARLEAQGTGVGAAFKRVGETLTFQTGEAHQSSYALEDLNNILHDVNATAHVTGRGQTDLQIALSRAGSAAGYVARELTGLPEYVQTRVLTPGAIQSFSDVQRLARQFGLTPKQVATIIKATGVDASLRQIRELRHELALLKNKTITVTTLNVTRGNQKRHEYQGATRQASGGLVRGPGTTTSDSIPAWLSDREYVIRAAAVDRYGVDMFHRLNALTFSQGGQARVSGRSVSASPAPVTGGVVYLTGDLRMIGHDRAILAGARLVHAQSGETAGRVRRARVR